MTTVIKQHCFKRVKLYFGAAQQKFAPGACMAAGMKTGPYGPVGIAGF
jgi:hypothetical protein